MGTATGEVHIVILTDTCFEHFFKPVGIGVILEMIFSGGTVQLVTAGQRSVGVGACLTDVLAVLVGIHYVIDTTGNVVHTYVPIVVYFQRLVFLTAFGSDDDHTVGCTRTVNGSSRCILQNLDGFNIV